MTSLRTSLEKTPTRNEKGPCVGRCECGCWTMDRRKLRWRLKKELVADHRVSWKVANRAVTEAEKEWVKSVRINDGGRSNKRKNTFCEEEVRKLATSLISSKPTMKSVSMTTKGQGTKSVISPSKPVTLTKNGRKGNKSKEDNRASVPNTIVMRYPRTNSDQLLFFGESGEVTEMMESNLSYKPENSKSLNKAKLEQTGDDQVEPREVLQTSLDEFSRELTKLPPKEVLNLNLALKEVPFVARDDSEFRLAFLRAESFDAKKAAKRFAKYWDARVSLFGRERAFLPLTQDAALRHDQETLRGGYLQTVRGHERIFFFNPDGLPNTKKYDVDSVVRSVVYVMETQVRGSLKLQREGYISIVDFGAERAMNFDHALLSRMSPVVNNALPVKVGMTCIIRPPIWAHYATEAMKVFMKPENRKKMKTVTNDEQLKKLTGVASVNELLEQHHTQWLDEVRKEEQANDTGSKLQNQVLLPAAMSKVGNFGLSDTASVEHSC